MLGNVALADGYSSRPQQVRRISEDWVARYGFCLRCDADRLIATAPNTRTRDFVCDHCQHSYELKSKRGPFTTRIADGAYGAMMATIRAGSTPTFLLLEYSSSWSITGLRAIHHSLITETCIEQRRPLSASAKRAGWIGCNILLPLVAVHGQIPIVQNGILQAREQPRKAFARLEQLSLLSVEGRRWASTILTFVESLKKETFNLADMYEFEGALGKLYPHNKNIRPKIRQQLQVLRDCNLLRFQGRGNYELVNS